MTDTTIQKGPGEWAITIRSEAICRFTDGPMQRRLLCEAARRIAALRMEDEIIIDADAPGLRSLIDVWPELDEITLQDGAVFRADLRDVA